jgi:O-antigen/teichoic acid export membrane protein
MSLAVAVAKNTVVQTTGKLASIALGWVTLLALTNYLGAAGFGAYTIMAAYLQLFAVAADLGLVLVSSQLFAERPEERDRVFANLLGFRVATAALPLAAATLLVWLLPYSAVVKQGVAVLAGSFFLVALLQVFTGLFQKELAMGRAVAGELAGRLTLLAAVLTAIAQGRGVLFVAAAVVASSAVNLAVAAGFARRFVRLAVACEPALWRVIWQRAWPITVGIVLNLVYLKADTLVLSLVRAEAEVGVYGAMYRVFEVLVTFPTMFAGLLLPVLASAWARQERVAFAATAQRGFDALLLAAVPLVVGVGFTAPRLARLFGPEFATAGLVLWLLVAASAAIFAGTFFGHLVVAANRQRAMLWAYGLTAGVSVVGYVAFIPPYGALAAAALTVVAEALVATLGYIVVRRTLDVSLSFAALGPALVAAAAMATLLWAASPLPLAVLVLLAAAVYLGVLIGLGAVPVAFLKQLVVADERRG